MPLYELWEWDMINGEYVYREEFEAKDDEEAFSILRSVIEEAREEGWECEEQPDGTFICTKTEDEYYYEHQVGVERKE